MKQEKLDGLCANIEGAYAEMLKRRIHFVEYGEPEKLTPKVHCKLNCQLLALALLHRAEALISATGAMLTAKNVYGLALVARGQVETTAVLGYFCKRKARVILGRRGSRGRIEARRPRERTDVR